MLNAETYYRSFPKLITSWRSYWNKELPFYYVQIAPFPYGGEIQNASIIRDAQLQTLKKSGHTGMVVTNDIGDLKDIHPENKQEITLYFKYAEDGLVMKGKELTCFEMAGTDQKFYPAKAKIEGNSVVVRSKEIDNPAAVRFAFSDTAFHNLFNGAGLPASPFRTDSWGFNID